MNKDTFDQLAYEEIYDQWQAYEYTQGQLRRYIIRELVNEYVGGGHVLEIGCGEGEILRFIKAERLVGLDLFPSLLQKARRLVGWADLVAGDAQAIPFADNTFDMIVFSEVIEHLPQPEQSIQHIYRICVPGGKVIVTTPNLYSPRRILAKLLTGRTGHRGHLHTFTWRSLEKILTTDAGFKVIFRTATSIEFLWHHLIPLGKRLDRVELWWKRPLARVLPALSDVLVLVVEKNDS